MGSMIRPLSAAPLLAAALAALGAVAAGRPASAQQIVQHSDSVLLDMAAAIVRGGPVANQLWHTPWYMDEFVILSQDGRAVVVLPELPPVQLGLPLDERVLGDSLPTLYLFPPVPGLPVRHGRQMLADRQILAWPQSDSIFGVHDPLFATVMVMYHEIFHLYQARARWVLPGHSEPPSEIVISFPFQQLAARERTLLVQGLEAFHPDSLKAILRSYLEVRVRRMNLLPVEARLTESTHETMEGTANFVAYRAALHALRGNEADLVARLKYDLEHTPPFHGPQGQSGSYRRWHVYATGAALAFLLERLRPGAWWQGELEDGMTYQQLIGAAVH